MGVRVDGLAPDRARELRGADGHPRHLRAERLGGEDERHARYAFRCRHAPSGPVGAASGAGPRVGGARAAVRPPLAEAGEAASQGRQRAVGGGDERHVRQVVERHRPAPARELAARRVLGQQPHPVAADEEVLQRRRLAGGGGAVVVGDARGHVDAAPAGGAGAPGDVGVLAEREEARVEAADRVEHRATVKGDARGCAEDLLDRAAFDRRRAREPVEPDAQPVDHQPRGVDRVAPRVEAHLPARRSDARHPGRAEEGDRGARLELGVVVDEQDPLARGGLHPRHDPAGEAEVAALGQDPCAGRGGTTPSVLLSTTKSSASSGDNASRSACEAGVEQRPAPLRDDDGADERHAPIGRRDPLQRVRRATAGGRSPVPRGRRGAQRRAALAHPHDRRRQVLRRGGRRDEPVDALLDQLGRRVVGVGDDDRGRARPRTPRPRRARSPRAARGGRGRARAGARRRPARGGRSPAPTTRPSRSCARISDSTCSRSGPSP